MIDISDIVLHQLECKRCGHAWIPRNPKNPKVCPKCKSPYWNKERVRKIKGDE